MGLGLASQMQLLRPAKTEIPLYMIRRATLGTSRISNKEMPIGTSAKQQLNEGVWVTGLDLNI